MGGIFTFKIRDRDIWDGMARREEGVSILERAIKEFRSFEENLFLDLELRNVKANIFR